MSEDRDDLDEWIRDIVMKISFEKEEEPIHACPDEEVLACYLDDLLSNPEKKKVEEHFLTCDKCLDEFLTMHRVKLQAEVEEPLALPKKLSQRLMALLPGQSMGLIKPLADLLLAGVNFIKSFFDALGTIDFSPQPIRGKVASSTQEGITFVRRFGDIKVKLRVEKLARERHDLLLRTFTADDRPIAQGLRVSLFQQTRELASYWIEEGEAHFEDIRPGKYKIRITRNNSTVGEFPLSFKGG